MIRLYENNGLPMFQIIIIYIIYNMILYYKSNHPNNGYSNFNCTKVIQLLNICC